MSIVLKLNESDASLRVVPLPPLIRSDGTSACTNESGRTFYFSIGGVDRGSGGSISAISAAMGLYECLFSASRISVAGIGRVYYGGVNSSSTAMVASTPIEVVRYDSYDSMRLGLFALPNVAAEAAGGLITSGTGSGQLSVSNGSVGLKAQTHSQATITGINNILGGTYSDVSFSVRNGGIQVVSVGAGNYSGVSVEIKTKGIATNSIETTNTYSSLTIQGLSNYANISNVTIHAGTYSTVTVRVFPMAYSGMTVGIDNIAAGSYSGVTIQGVSNLSSAVQLAAEVWAAGTHSGVTIDGVMHLSTAGYRSAASSLLSTVMGNSRIFQEGWYPLRNRVQISGSTGTVFLTDDATSAWTFSLATADFPISGINPAGP